MWYLVKWKGFELRPGTTDGVLSDDYDEKGDWEPKDNIGSRNKALVDWNKNRPEWWKAQDEIRKRKNKSEVQAKSQPKKKRRKTNGVVDTD